MAAKAFSPFYPAGRGLQNGQKLTNLFTGVEAMPSPAFGTQGAKPLASQKFALTVPSQTNTDFTFTLPAGATIRSMAVYTTTAFGAVTDAQISIGNAAAGAQYVAATSIKAVGVISLTLVAASAAALLSFPSGSPNLFVRIAQSGGNSATGAATLVVNYDIP